MPTRKFGAALKILATVSFLGFWSPGTAWSACIGTNLLVELQAQDPDAVEEMFSQAAAVPNAEGRFWKVERPGIDTSYILGSFHAAEAIDTLTDDMLLAFDEAAHVVVEVDLEQQAAMEERMATDISFAFDMAGPGLSTRLSPAQKVAVDAALRARGMALADVDQMRPWLLASLLSFPVCHLQGVAAGEQPMDTILAERALDGGATLYGLESYDTAVRAFQKIGVDVLLESIASTGKLSDREEDLFRTNLDLYADGRISAIAELGILIGEISLPELDHRAMNKQVFEAILDSRNIAWMPRLQAILSQGDAFVVVGALHLPGRLGLVELLRAEGYTLTRIDN